MIERDAKIRGAGYEKRIDLILTDSRIREKESLLEKMCFVRLPGGRVQMGTAEPLPCRLEGHRLNETRVRSVEVNPFWMNRYKVTNLEFEKFNPKRVRPPTSLGDTHPITNVTYFNALCYGIWLSEQQGLGFSLPTEPEWVFAAAPIGWEYPYHERKETDHTKSHNFLIGETEIYGTIPVNDTSNVANVHGLHQIGGNAAEFTLGSYYTSEGAWGAETDGRYCIVKGGDFGHCPLSAGVQRRAMLDISVRSERVSFRLMHSDLRNK